MRRTQNRSRYLSLLTAAVVTVAPLRILGPVFSGSANALSQRLILARQCYNRPVEVISGTATSASVAEAFERAHIPFRRTVFSDESLLDFLRQEVCKNQADAQFVLLSEIGTGYGYDLSVGGMSDVSNEDSEDEAA